MHVGSYAVLQKLGEEGNFQNGLFRKLQNAELQTYFVISFCINPLSILNLGQNHQTPTAEV